MDKQFLRYFVKSAAVCVFYPVKTVGSENVSQLPGNSDQTRRNDSQKKDETNQTPEDGLLDRHEGLIVLELIQKPASVL